MVVISEGLGIIDADTLPVREPHPMEAWAPEPGIPGATGVARIARRRPRHRDAHRAGELGGGRNNVIVRASEIAARQRAEEERREAERKAGPDP
jgi:hypothetical protein